MTKLAEELQMLMTITKGVADTLNNFVFKIQISLRICVLMVRPKHDFVCILYQQKNNF